MGTISSVIKFSPLGIYLKAENFTDRTQVERGKEGEMKVQRWQGESPASEVKVAGNVDRMTNFCS